MAAGQNLELEAHINTAGAEESPVLSADGQTLMFASNGLPGMGGFDLSLPQAGKWWLSEPGTSGFPEHPGR